MGGFLYARKAPGETIEATRSRHLRSLGALSAKGLQPGATIDGGHYAVFVYGKAQGKTENVWRGSGQDFSLSTGTLFYRGLMGEQALGALHRDFPGGPGMFADLAGQFCVLLSKGGLLWLFNDLYGSYHVFANDDCSVVSNSFVAVARSLGRRTISAQGLGEYLADGTTYGEGTVLEGVRRLDSDYVHGLDSLSARVLKANPYLPLDSRLPFEEQVERVTADLEGYVGLLHDHFGDAVSLALSGGYDSRHLVALLRAAGVKPYLYVYGPPDAADVKTAKVIADGEGFTLHHVDKRLQGQVEPERFPEIVAEQFHLHDGQGLYGAFGNGSDLATRRLRTETARLHLNGSCGEVYRNVFLLPNRRMRVGTFVRARHNWADWTIFAQGFDRDEYFRCLEEKIKASIGVQGDLLDRTQIEKIYPRIRARYRVAPCISVNNVHSHALAPFTEPRFAVPALGIPLRYKEHGRFHAALIRRIDPALARYPSVYGHSFEGSIPLKVRLRTLGIVQLSVLLEPLARFVKRRRQPRGVAHPWYLSEPYLRTLLDLDSLEIARHVHVDRIKGSSMLSRVLTVELLLRDRV
jgi:hypothetical protein